MTEQGILGAFASHAFLHGLGDRHLMILASGAKPFQAAPGEYLGKEGETAKALLLIQSGHVALGIPTPDRGVVPIQTVGPGEVVGWSWLVPPHRWQFDCRALDTVTGIAFDSQWLRDLCDQVQAPRVANSKSIYRRSQAEAPDERFSSRAFYLSRSAHRATE